MGASVGAGANVGSCGPADASGVVGGIDVCSPADASDDAAFVPIAVVVLGGRSPRHCLSRISSFEAKTGDNPRSFLKSMAIEGSSVAWNKSAWGQSSSPCSPLQW